MSQSALPAHRYQKLSCAECRGGAGLDFDFSFAFQPVVDAAAGRVIAYEALVRGPAGEPANAVLKKVSDENRYAFDQSCRVKAIALAARLGLDVVAEGVETEAEFRWLRAAGVSLFQGYYFARPAFEALPPVPPSRLSI